mmetsp:Transcript_49638/g.107532  ORF Transcript_49638/g.107532 Transcript_49638/m.107532 type:complete len:203 (+) Transcript_49638:271-879(+)
MKLHLPRVVMAVRKVSPYGWLRRHRLRQDNRKGLWRALCARERGHAQQRSRAKRLATPDVLRRGEHLIALATLDARARGKRWQQQHDRNRHRQTPDLELEPGSGCAFWAVGPSQIASKHSRDKRLSDKKLFTVTNLELLEQLEKRVCRNRQIGSSPSEGLSASDAPPDVIRRARLDGAAAVRARAPVLLAREPFAHVHPKRR